MTGFKRLTEISLDVLTFLMVAYAGCLMLGPLFGSRKDIKLNARVFHAVELYLFSVTLNINNSQDSEKSALKADLIRHHHPDTTAKEFGITATPRPSRSSPTMSLKRSISKNQNDTPRSAMASIKSIFFNAKQTLSGIQPAPIATIFPKVDPEIDGEDCDHDCHSCVVKYPKGFKIEQEDQLYGHIKGWETHVLVATGKTDWVRDVADEKGSVMEAIEKKADVKPSNGVCLPTSAVEQ